MFPTLFEKKINKLKIAICNGDITQEVKESQIVIDKFSNDNVDILTKFLNTNKHKKSSKLETLVQPFRIGVPNKTTRARTLTGLIQEGRDF